MSPILRALLLFIVLTIVFILLAVAMQNSIFGVLASGSFFIAITIFCIQITGWVLYYFLSIGRDVFAPQQNLTASNVK